MFVFSTPFSVSLRVRHVLRIILKLSFVHYFFLLVCEAAINAQQGKEETQGSSVLVLVDVWQGGEDVSGTLRHLHMEQFDPEQTKIAEAVDGSDRACSQ